MFDPGVYSEEFERRQQGLLLLLLERTETLRAINLVRPPLREEKLVGYHVNTIT